MRSYFNRDNVGLPGFAAFYRASSLEERTHAQQLMDFQVRTLLGVLAPAGSRTCMLGGMAPAVLHTCMLLASN